VVSLDVFPGAIPVEEYVKRTHAAAMAHGLVSGKTLAMVGVCRDELTDNLTEPVRASWGPPFRMSGMAGMLFLGAAGMRAAQHHAPGADGRQRFVIYVMPHVGIGGDGTLGVVNRPGQQQTTAACGALMGFRAELASGRVLVDLDPYDLEMSLLRQRLLRAIPYGEVPDVVALTKLARDAVLEDLVRIGARMRSWRDADVAVFSGIQIHTVDGDWVQPGHSSVRLGDTDQDIRLEI
jgi:limiting CO2-inducible B/C-like protein